MRARSVNRKGLDHGLGTRIEDDLQGVQGQMTKHRDTAVESTGIKSLHRWRRWFGHKLGRNRDGPCLNNEGEWQNSASDHRTVCEMCLISSM
eukprot:3391112-Pleurochrysis_carterae.AAC.2